MPRLCERPGCSAAATVTYGFDTVDLMVWLSPFEPDDKARPYGSGILCRRHADALVVPRGWHVDDRREAVPRLFVAPPTNDPPVSPVSAGKPRATRALAPEPVELFAVPNDEVVDAAAADADGLDETQAMPWSPRFLDDAAESDDANADEPARGGLLARAFGAKDRRERR